MFYIVKHGLPLSRHELVYYTGMNNLGIENRIELLNKAEEKIALRRSRNKRLRLLFLKVGLAILLFIAFGMVAGK